MQTAKGLWWSLGLGLCFLGLVLGSGSLLLVPVYADGGTIQVAPTGTDQADCGTGSAPDCRTIKYAVENRAQAGDQIVVAPGIYTDAFRVISPSLKLYGAGPGLTIIDGESARGPMVTFATGLTHSTIFSGFTIQNGVAVTHGGGIYLSDSAPTIQFATIQSNTAPSGYGGGLYLLNSSPPLTALQVQHNTALTGGGLFITGSSSPILRGNTLCGNSPVQLHNAGGDTIDAPGNWWGTNSPQSGGDYLGSVAATPAISINLTLQQVGSSTFPGGTTSLPGNTAGELSVIMRSNGYAPPPGTQVRLAANAPIFAQGATTITQVLQNGLASTIITPTVSGPLIISAFHNCYPDQVVVSTTIDIIDTTTRLYLPLIWKDVSTPVCPIVSSAQYSLIPVEGGPTDRPDYLHGDLNLDRRGYNLAPNVPLTLVDYSGGAGSNAPQLSGLFGDNRVPTFSAAYQVNDWIWQCAETHGCRGEPLDQWPTTLIGMATTPGENIFAPNFNLTIFSQGGQAYKAMVLYAEEKRITLNFTREDTVANGYSVHIENVCVDPNLLALYRAQVGADGFRISSNLPALQADQALGTALEAEIQVAIRDKGVFMDPRSRKDWWR